MKVNQRHVKTEIKKWEERVIYNVKFKEDTTANLKRLTEIYNSALDEFIMIAASSEPVVYKIGRFFLEQGLSNEQITFLDGKIIDAYLGDDSPNWKKKERVDQLIEIYGESFKHKWLLIPYMDFQIDLSTAIYFMNRIKQNNAIGVVMFADGPNNILEVLNVNMDDQYIYQFPVAKYRKSKKTLPEDIY